MSFLSETRSAVIAPYRAQSDVICFPSGVRSGAAYETNGKATGGASSDSKGQLRGELSVSQHFSSFAPSPKDRGPPSHQGNKIRQRCLDVRPLYARYLKKVRENAKYLPRHRLPRSRRQIQKFAKLVCGNGR